MFCMACGEKITPNAKFCSKCGTSVVADGSAATPAAEPLSSATLSGVAVDKWKLAGISKQQAVAGLFAAGFLVWWLAPSFRLSNQDPSDTMHNSAVSDVKPVQSAPTPVAQPAPAPHPAAEPVRTYYTVASGAPLCSSFKGAITAAAVMRSGNPMAIDAVLSRQGCETSPQHIELDPGASVQELQAGVVVINTPSGDRIYTTADSLSTSRH
jgi:hypothetical protein